MSYFGTYLLLLFGTLSVLHGDRCPTLDEFLARSPYLAQFNPHLYSGIWYELAFYDYTQFSKACGCTHLNWTLSTTNASLYLDDFITTCPMEPVWLRKNYTVHMNGTVSDQQYPFFIPETGFHIQFNNTVGMKSFFLRNISFVCGNLISHFLVYYRQSNNNLYDRAIQYQCKVDETGKRIFTGINFLSRTHLNSDDERKHAIDEMALEAIKAGVEQQYLQQLKIVQWLTC
jgi:hypothetical protein